VNPEALLARLEPFKFEADERDKDSQFDQMSLPGVMLMLAEINHEREYDLCRRVALHLQGQLDEPEDIVLE
jgi:hypothetical protein